MYNKYDTVWYSRGNKYHGSRKRPQNFGQFQTKAAIVTYLRLSQSHVFSLHACSPLYTKYTYVIHCISPTDRDMCWVTDGIFCYIYLEQNTRLKKIKYLSFIVQVTKFKCWNLQSPIKFNWFEKTYYCLNIPTNQLVQQWFSIFLSCFFSSSVSYWPCWQWTLS